MFGSGSGVTFPIRWWIPVQIYKWKRNLGVSDIFQGNVPDSSLQCGMDFQDTGIVKLHVLTLASGGAVLSRATLRSMYEMSAVTSQARAGRPGALGFAKQLRNCNETHAAALLGSKLVPCDNGKNLWPNQ